MTLIMINLDGEANKSLQKHGDMFQAYLSLGENGLEWAYITKGWTIFMLTYESNLKITSEVEIYSGW